MSIKTPAEITGIVPDEKMFDRVNTPTILIDSSTGDIFYANQAACKFYGYKKNQFIRVNFDRLIDKSSADPGINYKEAYSGKKTYFSQVHHTAHGETRQVAFFCGPFVIGDRKMIVAMIHDNSGVKQTEERIKIFSQAIEQSPVSIVITDKTGQIEYVNPKFTTLTGYTLEEALGKDPAILKTGSGNRDEIKDMWQTILSGRVWRGEFCNKKKNGDIYWESASISPVFNEKGQITNFVAVKEDITRSREDQIKIAESNKFNKAILQSSPIGITIYNSNGQCISANPAAAKILGASPEELLKQNFHNIKAWKTYGMLDIAMRAIERNEPVSSELFYASSFGKEAWLDLVCTPFQSDTSNDLFLLFMFEDFTGRKQTELDLQKATEELSSSVERLEKKDQAATCMRELGEMLQVCNLMSEAFDVIKSFGSKIFPDTSGCVFLMNDAGTLLDTVSCWGDDLQTDLEFKIDDCWSIRRGQMHIVDPKTNNVTCRHLPESFEGSYIGLPLIASGDIIGLLHIEWPDKLEIDHDTQDYVQNVAEMISLSLSNIRLREKLRDQSIRDPLTGVFNRRYMEETIDREFPRAKRKKSSIGVMMMDIDFFKKFNDSYGHEAGDLVLQKTAEIIQRMTRKEDIVCRYGGEELTVIMPDADLDTTYNRAESIRKAIEDMDLVYEMNPVGKVTISIGVAIYPDHGESGQDVIQSADKALYKAKGEGRNRVTRA